MPKSGIVIKFPTTPTTRGPLGGGAQARLPKPIVNVTTSKIAA